jgi:hypothetical protein
VQDGARLIERKDRHALLIVPGFPVQVLERRLEFFQLPLGLKCDFELGEIDILRVVEACQEQAVHDLRQHLIAGPDPAIRGDVENHRVRGDFLVDGIEDNAELVVVCPRREQLRGWRPHDVAVFDRKPQHLGEAGLAASEEAGDPDGDAFVRLLRGFLIALQHPNKVFLDRVGHDVLADFRSNPVGRGLVDLDDLLDLPGDVVVEKRCYLAHGVHPSEDLGAVIMLGIEHAHEANPGRPVEVARIKQDRRNQHAALQLLQQ